MNGKLRPWGRDRDRASGGRTRQLAGLLTCLLLGACGGGSGGSPAGTDTTPGNCSGNCADTSSALTVADVQTVLAQGIAEAKAQGANATLAVVDRVGNVLAVYRMGTEIQPILIATAVDADGAATIRTGLEGIALPQAGFDTLALDHQAAIAKAVTGAYLSSEGNAFSTRTASQIVQEHFNPGERDQPGGPLFGVQFSQLACSDFMRRESDAGDVGPQRSPLGLSADPGGFPLYKNGTVVGGVGVIADGLYSLDAFIADSDRSVDELIATAATFGFAAPLDRRADRITVEGKTFRFSDVGFGNLARDPATAPAFGTLTPADGALIEVLGYTDGTLRAGVAFGTPASGVRPDTVDYPGLDAFVFVDEADQLRYPPIDGTDGLLDANEVRTLLREALSVANRARAQIRRPLSSSARVTISVVDTRGAILGMVRSRDAPLFGADVSLQKARTAALFSAPGTAAFLTDLPPGQYVRIAGGTISTEPSPIGDYVTDLQDFLGVPTALQDGGIAFSDRAIGNLARPFYPDGLISDVHGPLSKARGEWSPFSTGLQLDLVLNAILNHVLFVAGANPMDVTRNCAGAVLLGEAPEPTSLLAANGIQIFPGGVPLYRGDVLVGAIGVSGDGIDQDDMVAMLGAHQGGVALGSLGNAPAALRADTQTPRGVRLRYVQCPQAPFLNSTEEGACADK